MGGHTYQAEGILGLEGVGQVNDEQRVDLLQDELLAEDHRLPLAFFDPLLFQLFAGVHFTRSSWLAGADLAEAALPWKQETGSELKMYTGEQFPVESEVGVSFFSPRSQETSLVKFNFRSNKLEWYMKLELDR